jgi:hypothetical protein
MKSIFLDKNERPTAQNIRDALGETFDLWRQFIDFTKSLYPDAQEEWHFSGEKFGWSYRIKDKKRVILYLLPRDRFFKAALVFWANSCRANS